MDLSKQKKPSLPRLATNIPVESQFSPSLPLLPKRPHEGNVEPKQPKAERPITLPCPFPGRAENIAPTVHYVPDAKGLYMTDDFGDPAIIKKKTQYYEEAFATRGVLNSPQDRVIQGSVVVVELKTNCQVCRILVQASPLLIGFQAKRDEQQQLASDLIFRLAQIYQRPETCIMLTVQQNAGVFFGNVPELSYLLKVYALPPFIAPLTNMRNTNLIQVAMLELLGIPMSQGVIIYIPVPEDNFATNGLTARGEITRLERHDQDDSPNIFKSISRTMSRRLKTSSGQSMPISLPSTVGTATTSPPVIVHSSPVSPEEERGRNRERGVRKRMSLRTIVRQRFNEMTSSRDTSSREKDEKEKLKENVKAAMKRDEDKGKAKQESTRGKLEEESAKETKGQ